MTSSYSTTRRRFGLAAVIGLVALFLAALRSTTGQLTRQPAVRGKNNTVLFLADCHPGFSNTHYATASALLENHPDVSVHVASFPAGRKDAETTSTLALRRNPSARPVVFHPLPGPSYVQTLEARNYSQEAVSLPPGLPGLEAMLGQLVEFLSPWPVDDHVALAHHIASLIDEVDPAVVVLDSFLTPGVDAARMRNRLSVVVTPNAAVDSFADSQPWGQMFWKYPALGSGFPFPVSLADIPSNMYQRLRLISGVLRVVATSPRAAALRARGIPDPVSMFNLHRPDMPWISATLLQASLPLSYLPPNVTLAGPIVRASAPLTERDPELAGWLARGGEAGTVFVNLGSSVKYSEVRAGAMALALAEVLRRHPGLRVLWKFRRLDGDEYGDEFAEPLRRFIEEDRVRMPGWIEADPFAVLESGYVALFVHHGGAGCYGEGVLSGVPQAILPLWLDLYNYAAMVEDFGIGVWAGKQSSPAWKAEELAESFLQALDRDDPESVSMREKAAEIGRIARADPGREVAARLIAKLAASGS